MNNNRIPYVTLTISDDSKYNTESESTDQGEEDDEEKKVENFDGDKTIVESKNINVVLKTDDKDISSNSDQYNDGNVEGLIKKFTLLSNIKNINFGIIEKLHCTQLAKSNLPCTSYIYVTYSSDPSNFTVRVLVFKIKN
jgi:hypothetical protein